MGRAQRLHRAGSAARRDSDRLVEAAFVFYGEPFDPARFIDTLKDSDDRPSAKPYGGLWASPSSEDGSSAWEDWSGREGLRSAQRPNARQRVIPHPDARILTLDTLADLDAAYERYLDERLLPFFPDDFQPRYLRWSMVARDYDAVTVTANLLAAARRDLDFLDMRREMLLSWDVPSTCFLRASAFTVAAE